MGTRGRKSGAEIATAGAVALIERPTSPLELTPEQSDEWVKIVNSMPADWFSPENHALLMQYCRHVVNARRLAQLIDQECARDEVSQKNLCDLMAAEHKQSSAMKALAASMRLSQQSKYNAQSASTASKRSGKTVKRPWES